MTTEVFETLNKFTQQTLENWKKLGEINLKIGQSLLSEQIELTTALVEATTKSAEEASKTKDVKEIAALQAELAQETGKLLVDSARSTADIRDKIRKRKQVPRTGPGRRRRALRS